MTRLSSSSPVTAMTTSARSAPASASVEASSALPRSTTLPSSLAIDSARSALFSISSTSCSCSISSRARKKPTFPPPATIAYIALGPRRLGPLPGQLFEELVGADDGRADGAQPQLGKRVRAERVVDARHHALDAEEVLRDLA